MGQSRKGGSKPGSPLPAELGAAAERPPSGKVDSLELGLKFDLGLMYHLSPFATAPEWLARCRALRKPPLEQKLLQAQHGVEKRPKDSTVPSIVQAKAGPR